MNNLVGIHSISSNGQGLYISAGSGYGFSAFPQVINHSGTYYYDNFGNGSQIYDNIVGSYSSGINFNAAIGYNFSKQGYNFSKHIVAEIGVSYVSGKIYQVTDYLYFGNNYSGLIKTDFNLQGKMWRIVPTFKLYSEPSTITPYLKAGIVFGVGGIIIMDYVETQSSNPPNGNSLITDASLKFTEGISYGLMAAAGADLFISKQFGIYLELGFTGQTWAPEHSEYTKDNINGQDQLSTMTVNQKVTNYTNNLNITYPQDPNQPTIQLKQFNPFSDWGFKLGVKYNFGKQ